MTSEDFERVLNLLGGHYKYWKSFTLVDDIITTEHAALLASSLRVGKMSRLTTLGLSSNAMCDESLKTILKAISETPSLHLLQNIDLLSNIITDDGAKDLAGLIYDLPQLRRIDLRMNPVTEIGTAHIMEAQKHSTSPFHFMISTHDFKRDFVKEYFRSAQEQDRRMDNLKDIAAKAMSVIKLPPKI